LNGTILCPFQELDRFPLRIRKLVSPAVDEIGIEISQLGLTVEDPFHDLHAQHERVVLVADFILSAIELPAGVNLQRLQERDHRPENFVTFNGRDRIAVVQSALSPGFLACFNVSQNGDSYGAKSMGISLETLLKDDSR